MIGGMHNFQEERHFLEMERRREARKQKKSLTDERASFEQWAKENFQEGCNLTFDEEANQYKNMFVQHSWFGWCGKARTYEQA